jgi:pimeloyl-ACP methyl ester carboxylesterase
MAEVTVRGARFHVQRIGQEGREPRVVFLHGLVMDNLSSFFFTLGNRVATFADVLLYDLRGHGLSEKTRAGYTLADMVLDLEALTRTTFGERPVVLVGNSFGALLAVAFARAYPARVRGLALLDGHMGDDDFGERMASTLSLEGEDAERVIAERFKDWLGRHSQRKRSRLAEHARALVTETSLVADMKATPPLVPADFEQIEARTLAIFGEASDIRERSEKLVLRMPHAELVVLPGCSHSILWEATAEVTTRVADFCKALGAPAPDALEGAAP